MLKILYLVPNLADAAVSRRVSMLRRGGAAVELAGFRRADAPAPDFDLPRMLEIDVTRDADFSQRLKATLRACWTASRWGRAFSRPDVIIARNLEMLAVANRVRALWAQPPALVYECLDIHRLMLRPDAVGQGMRLAERRLFRRASLLLTSSPAFLRHHFDRQEAPPAMLVENKVLAEADEARGTNPALAGTQAGLPLRIGWFGALRCRKSLSALATLARDLPDRVDVTLRGRPARTEFDDFDAAVTTTPGLRFAGAYSNPDDLASIYSDVHLAWAIDFFEEGQNSSWLLPNRIYEGCLHGAIPIVLAGTETARFAAERGIGIEVPDIAPQTLTATLLALTPGRVRELAEAVAASHASHFRCTAAECRNLVARLTETAAKRPRLEAAA